MIRPEELQAGKLLRVQDLVTYAIKTYADQLVGQVPDVRGYYLVGLSSLEAYTSEEKRMAKEMIENDMAESGWEFEEQRDGIFKYSVRPAAK